MGQIKNIKLHIVTDIKLVDKQSSEHNGRHKSSSCPRDHVKTSEELGACQICSCHRSCQKKEGFEREETCCLQEGTAIRERVQGQRKRRNPSSTHGQARR